MDEDILNMPVWLRNKNVELKCGHILMASLKTKQMNSSVLPGGSTFL